ncbi:MAG: murein biosynthesis integral membrane protein MurJ [Mycobacteriales bacterium]
MTTTTGGSLVRGGATMAIGTIASRVTGFLRTAVLTAALGYTGVQDAYQAGNTVPNIVYDLLLGGVLSSVLVPMLVQAERDDADDGAGFLSTIFMLIAAAMIVVTVIGELVAPWLMDVYLNHDIQGSERELAVTLTRFFLPQVLFYALTALFSAVLTIRGRFGAVGLVPLVNNVVVIAVVAVFFTTSRHARDPRGWNHLTGGQSLLLGVGTTLGVVAMAAALLPSLARAGVRIRCRLDLSDPRLREVARLGGWVFVYAVANQIGYAVISNLATRHRGDGSVYVNAFQLFSLPYAIVTVSVISALMPGLSAAALDRDRPAVVGQLSRALRLSGVLLVPATLGIVVLAGPLSTAALHYGAAGSHNFATLGRTLAVFAVALVPFSAYLLLLRVFYARHDSRTPALINIWANVVNIVADVVLVTVLPADQRIPGLAAGFVLSYVVGTALAVRLLRRSLGGIDGRRVTRLFVRVGIGSVLGAAVAGGVAAGVEHAVGSGTAAAVLATTLAGVGGAVVYVWAARRMRVTEVTGLLAMLRR